MKWIYLNILLLFFIAFGCKPTVKTQKVELRNLILIVCNGSDLSEKLKNDHKNKAQPPSFFTSVVGYSRNGNKQISETLKTDYITPLTIGEWGNGESLGLNSEGIACPNIIELMSVKGKSTGIITLNSMVSVVPASFLVHVLQRNDSEYIASEVLNSPVNLFAGKGKQYLTNRKDGLNLVYQFQKRGYVVSDNQIDNSPTNKKIVIENDYEPDSLSVVSKSFFSSVDYAVNQLNLSRNGFCLIIDFTFADQGQTAGKATQKPNLDLILEKILIPTEKLKETLVIVTTDSEIKLTDELSNCFSENLSNEWILPVFSYGNSSEVFKGEFDRTMIFKKLNQIFNLE